MGKVTGKGELYKKQIEPWLTLEQVKQCNRVGNHTLEVPATIQLQVGHGGAANVHIRASSDLGSPHAPCKAKTEKAPKLCFLENSKVSSDPQPCRWVI